MQITFTLDPIDEIQPWGEPPNLTLNWYGLSYGTYFLEAGQHNLLRYSDAALQWLASQYPKPEFRPYVDYQVARLFEDICDIAPHVLEPIPDNLVRYVSSGLHRKWEHECRQWLERKDGDNDAWNNYYDAVGWANRRHLDTGYLLPGATVWFWRRGDLITIAWDNRDHKFDAIPAWSEQQGQFALSAQEFTDELESFRHRFLEAMRSRVEEVCRSWSRAEIAIDLKQLVKEQTLRDSEQLRPLSPATDWSSVARAINRIAGSS